MNSYSAILLCILLPAILFFPNTDASGASKKIERYRSDVRKMAGETLNRLYAEQPNAKQLVKGAAGYAVFSNFGLTILFVGGGKGSGMAVNRRTGKEVFMKMFEGQLGIGIGVKKFRFVFVFENERSLDRFIYKGWELDAQTTAAAKLDDRGGVYEGAISVAPGVWVFQLTDDGLALELTAKVSKFYIDEELN